MHGTFNNGRPSGPSPSGGGEIRLILRLLLRELAVGCILHLLLGRNAELNIIVCAVVFTALLAITNKHGLLRHRSKLGVATECIAILMGGLAFRTLLVIGLTLIAWH